MRKKFNFFELKFGKNIKFFDLRLTKILSLLFDLIAFFLLTCCFLEFCKTTDVFEFKFEFTALVQNIALLLLPWVYKISHWCNIFCTDSQYPRYGRARGAIPPPPPSNCLCPPPHFGFSKCFFGASRNDKTTGNDKKTNNNFQTSFLFKVFSIVSKSTGHQLLCINVTQ